MTKMRAASCVLLLLLASCGSGGGGSSAPPSSAPADSPLAESFGAAAVLATHRHEVPAHDIVFVLVGSRVDELLLTRVIDRMNPGDPRGAAATLRNWIALGQSQDPPPAILVDSFVYHLVIETATATVTSNPHGLEELAALLGVPMAGDGLPTPTSLAIHMLPESAYPGRAAALVDQFHQGRPEQLLSLALDYLTAEMRDLRETGEQAVSRQDEQYASARRDRVLSVAASAKTLLSMMGEGPQSAARMVEGLATLSVAGSRFQYAFLPHAQDPTAPVAVPLFGGIGDFFSDVGDSISNAVESSAEWVADAAESVGEIFFDYYDDCTAPDNNEGCTIPLTPDISFKMQDALQETSFIAGDGFVHIQNYMLNMDSRLAQATRMMVGLDSHLDILTNQVERLTETVVTAMQALSASLTQTHELIASVAQSIRADIDLARQDIVELRTQILWYFNQQALQAMETEYLRFDQLAAQALSAIRYGDAAALDSALAQMRVITSQAPRTVFARDQLIGSIEDCISALTTLSIMPPGSAGHVGSGVGVARTLAGLINAPVSVTDVVNLQALSYLSNVYIDVLSQAGQLHGDLSFDRAFLIQTLTAARQDNDEMLQELLQSCLDRMSETLPAADLEFRDVFRAALDGYVHLEGGLLASWNDVGPWIDDSGEFRFPIRPLTGQVVHASASSTGWVYRVGSDSFTVEGDDSLRVAGHLGLVRVLALTTPISTPPFGVAVNYYLVFRFPNELVASSPQLAQWNGAEIAYLGGQGPGQPSTVFVGPNTVGLSLSNFQSLNAVHGICQTAVNAATAFVFENRVLPRIRDTATTPSMRRLAGLTAIARWALTEVQRYAGEDPERSRRVIELLRSPLMTGSRLFSLGSEGVGSVAERYQAAMADHFMRLADANATLPEGMIAYQDSLDGLDTLIEDLDAALSQEVLPWLGSGSFWCSATDNPLLWSGRL